MDKQCKKKAKMITLVTVSMLFIGVLSIWGAEAGSSDDPVVSLSYLNSVFMPKVTEYIDNKVLALGLGANTSGGTAESFKVIEVKNGQRLIGGEGCEMILRMGSGTIIATQKGGVSDITGGADLPNGANMPSNHMLIVPLPDGRGFRATSDVLVMVKGSYAVQ